MGIEGIMVAHMAKVFSWNDKNELWIIMSLEISDLDDLHKERNRLQKFYSIEEVLQSAREILIILKNIHKINLYHLDIKLPNLVFDKDNNKVLIIDFGTSQYSSEGEFVTLKGISLACMPLFLRSIYKEKGNDKGLIEILNKPLNCKKLILIDVFSVFFLSLEKI